MTAPSPDAAFLRRARLLLEPLLRYHRFTIEGLEHVPAAGPALLVVHHTLATYDGFLLADAIFQGTGRLPRGLGDDRIFQIPGLKRLAYEVGIVPASPEAGAELLAQGHILGVAPGGMWESLRPSGQARQSRWAGRRGFVRLALRCGVPMIFGAVPAADDLFRVYDNPLTDAVYERFHLPLPLARGRGLSLVPRRLPLRAYLSAPLVPPLYVPEAEEAQIDALHAAAAAAMAGLLRKK